MPKTFYPRNDRGAVEKIVDDSTRDIDREAVVNLVHPDGSAQVQIFGDSNYTDADSTRGLPLKSGDRVRLHKAANTRRWVIDSVILTRSMVGDLNSPTSPDGALKPLAAPEDITATNIAYGIAVRWSPPGARNDMVFEVQVADDILATNDTIYRVAGGSFFVWTNVTQYIRVRSVGEDWSRSGWTVWVSGAAAFADISETVDDRIAALLIQGSGIDLDYDDAANTLIVSSTVSPVTVAEDDGLPSVSNVNQIIFPAGTVTDDGGGVVRVSIPAASAGELLVTKKTIETRTVIYDTTLSVDGPFDITGIAQTYDRLEFEGALRTTSAGAGLEELFMFFNNDTAHANYWFQQLYGYAGGGAGGGSAGANNNIGHVFQAGIYVAAMPTMRGHIDRYAETSFQKDVTAETPTFSQYYMIRQTHWYNTAAINRITLSSNVSGNSFKAGSRFKIIGIKTEQVVVSVAGDLTDAVKDYETSFVYDESSPILVRSAAAGERIIECKVLIDTAFDAATTLTIGEAGGVDRLLAADGNDPLQAGSYGSWPEYTYLSNEDIHLYIATTATQGAGRVIIRSRG